MNEHNTFKDYLQLADLSVKQFSNLTETPLRTVYHWIKDEARTPGIVFKYLDLYIKLKQS